MIHTNSPRCQVQLPTLFLFNGVVKCLKIYQGWLILMKPGEEAPSHGRLHQSFRVRLSVPEPLLIDLDVRSGISWYPPPPHPPPPLHHHHPLPRHGGKPHRHTVPVARLTNDQKVLMFHSSLRSFSGGLLVDSSSSQGELLRFDCSPADHCYHPLRLPSHCCLLSCLYCCVCS